LSETSNQKNKRPKSLAGFWEGLKGEARVGIATTDDDHDHDGADETIEGLAQHVGIRWVRRLPRQRRITEAVGTVKMDATHPHVAVGRDDAGKAEGIDSSRKV
jgi:hypothetical protein